MKSVFFITLGLSVGVFAITPMAAADVPNQMHYQGQLTDDLGAPLDTVVSMTFTVYDDSSGAIVLWTETQTGVEVSQGLFNVLLGSDPPIPDTVFADDWTWLGIQIGADPEIAPLTKLVTVPYAFRVSTVDGATGGVISGDVAIQSDLDLNGDLRVTGKATIGPGHSNTGTNSFVAGQTNSVSNWGSTVGGGSSNVASQMYSAVSGGAGNSASGVYSSVSGGAINTAGGGHSAVGGGEGNTASNVYSTVGGGYQNAVDGDSATISGGSRNSATGNNSTIGGGTGNEAAFIGVGPPPDPLGGWSTVSGGRDNRALGDYSAIGGGQGNTAQAGWTPAYGGHSTVAGGEDNNAFAMWSTVGGGHLGSALAPYTTVGGGYMNVAGVGLLANPDSGQGATVAGGYDNRAAGDHSTVGGGFHNAATGGAATVAGGMNDTASAPASAVCGGDGNHAAGRWSTVIGGYKNFTEGMYTVALGGLQDTLTADSKHSMAFGFNVYVDQWYRAVLFNGDHHGRLGLNRDDRDTISHVIHVGTDGSNGNGAHLTFGGTWTNGSSRTFKENFERLDSRDLLAKISDLPVEAWQYKNSDERHIGPVSEDFVQAFDVGTVRSDGSRDNHYLSPGDVAGVALAGVKELLQKNEQLTRENQELRRMLEDLKQRINRLEKGEQGF